MTSSGFEDDANGGYGREAPILWVVLWSSMKLAVLVPLFVITWVAWCVLVIVTRVGARSEFGDAS